MNYPSILLVSSSELGDGIGEQFLCSLTINYPILKLYRYVLSTSLNSSSIFHHGVKTQVSKALRSSIPIVSSLNYYSFQKKSALVYHLEIDRLICEHNIDVIWFVLNSEQIIEIASTLKNTKCRIVCHVWDTPDYILKVQRILPFFKKKILENFDIAMKRSDFIVGISQNMVNLYKAKYKKDGSVIYFSSRDSFVIKKSHEFDKNRLEIKVVFTGSLYAWKEWNSFLNAVEKYNLSNPKFKIKVYFFGGKSRWAKMPCWVSYNASIESSEALKIVSDADIAYLPYWMDKKYRETVNLAFPSKLSFYTTASTPIFFHGTHDSNPGKFCMENDIGIVCESYNEEKIINGLLYLISDKFTIKYSKIIEQVYNENFNFSSPSNSFMEIISSFKSRDF